MQTFCMTDEKVGFRRKKRNEYIDIMIYGFFFTAKPSF